MSYGSERAAIGALLATFTAAPVLWPGGSLEPPAPTSPPAEPAAFVAVEVEYTGAELADFAGGARVDGEVVCEVWSERRAGDDRVRDLVDALRSLFRAGDAAGLQFLEPRAGGAAVSDVWYGRGLRVPFVRWEA
ncbi:MAG: hypothetical protein BWX64_02474 [Acidobacteria bacterium ADurb.Bin051]|nr:MAG: hypothetical protein BWX64_02474 [Acidobacteria bacterium ADurb.Bin051]